MRLKALVLAFSDLGRDPRVHRQIRFLTDRFDVLAAGYADPQIPGVEFLPVTRTRKSYPARLRSAVQLLTGQYGRFYWEQPRVRSVLSALDGRSVDVVLANDIETLPLALRLARGAAVVFDAHEYAPRQFEDRLLFRLFFQGFATALCREYIPQVDGMMTVGEAIARQYERDTGVRAIVVTNAPDHEDLEPGPPDPAGRIRLVHHGGATPSRKIERMIQMMDYLDERFGLDLVLVGGPKWYRAKLARLARRNPRVQLVDPVPMLELSRFLNRYDMGVYLLEPVSFNTRYALPNKLFEFIQARLAVAIGPSPEMARVVTEYGVGVVAKDFSPEALAEKISACGPDRIAEYKLRAHAAAPRLCAEANRERVLSLVDRAVSRRSRAGGGIERMRDS
ncbi:MAG TPA: glycosyltransferase [Longimicrobiales bacterium]